MEHKRYSKSPICIITGGTGGIGKALVRELFVHNATILVVARNPNKYNDLIHEIKQDTPTCKIHKNLQESLNYSEGPSIGFYQADLSLLSDIFKISKEIISCYKRIDILINNVGGYFAKRTLTDEGFELTFSLNYLGPLLMSYILLPSLLKSENGQILNISSSAHKMGKIDLDDLQLVLHYVGLKAYAQSKLAINLLTQELAIQFQSRGIRVNSIHPGVVKTNIAQSHRGLQSLIFKILKHTIAIKPDKAAQRIFNVLFLEKYQNINGSYISKTKIVKYRHHLEHKKLRKKLLNLSWKLIYPKIESPYKEFCEDKPYCEHEITKYLTD